MMGTYELVIAFLSMDPSNSTTTVKVPISQTDLEANAVNESEL